MTSKTESKTETRLREDLKTVCHLAYGKGLISGYDGNLSLKVSDKTILVTPKGSHKGLIETSDFVLVDLNGDVISNGSKEPTSDLTIHLKAYKKRKDIKAIIHAHPPTVVSLTVSKIEINQPVIPDIIISLGEISTIPYPGTDREVECDLTIDQLEKHDVVVLDRHGAVTVGNNIFNTLHKMELLEYTAKVIYYSYNLGDIHTLDRRQIDELTNERFKIFGEEVKSREGDNLFQSKNQAFKLKNLFKKLLEGNSPVFQRILNLTNELLHTSIQKTSYSEKLSDSEKEQLSREMTASLVSMIFGRFTKKP